MIVGYWEKVHCPTLLSLTVFSVDVVGPPLVVGEFIGKDYTKSGAKSGLFYEFERIILNKFLTLYHKSVGPGSLKCGRLCDQF